MANDLVVKLSGDSKGFQESINSAKDSLKGLQQEGTKIDQFQTRFDKVVNSAKPMKKQLADLRGMLAEMNREGLNTSTVFTQIAEHAGSLADNIGDAQSAVKAFANDNFNLQASAEAFQVVAAGGALVTGAMAMMGVESEKATEIIAKVQGAIALLNGVQSIANLLNKDSALMLKLKQVQMKINEAQTKKNTIAQTANNVSEATGTATKVAATTATTASTVAQVANTTATTAATVAKNGLNTAIAIGKALLGDWSGLLLLGAGALATYSIATSDSTDSQKKQAGVTKEQANAIQKYKDAVVSSATDLITTYKKLQVEWEQLSTKQQKLDWIETNIDAFRRLGLQINSVTDAENAFIKNSDNVVKALVLRAAQSNLDALLQSYVNDAMGNLSKYTSVKAGDNRLAVGKENYNKWAQWARKKYGDNFDWSQFFDGQNWSVSGAASFREWAQINFINEINQGKARYKEMSGLINKNLVSLADSATSGLAKPQTTPTPKIPNYSKSVSSSHTSSSHTEEKVYDKDSLKYAEQQLSKYQQLIEESGQSSSKYAEYQKQAKYWNEEVKKRQEIADAWKKEQETYIQTLEKELKTLQDDKMKMSPTDIEGIAKQEELIKQKEQELKDARLLYKVDIELDPTSKQGLEKQLSDLQDDLIKIITGHLEGDIEAQKKKIIEVLKIIKEIDDKADYTSKTSYQSKEDPEFFDKGSIWDKRGSYRDAMSDIDQIGSDLSEGLISYEDAKQQVQDIIDQVANDPNLKLKLNVEIDKDGTVHKIQSTFEKLGTTLGYVGDAVHGVGEAMKNVAGENVGLQKAALVASAVGQLVMSFATAMTQAAAQGPWAWIAAGIAGAATLTALIAQIQGFESGGIIGGNSYSGDRILARVNSGEMILNKNQQANLFNAISSGNLGSNMGGKVTFEIQGTTLKGVLNNIDRKMSKIR